MNDYVQGCEALVVETGSGAIMLRGTDAEFGQEVMTWLCGSDITAVLDQVTALALGSRGSPEEEAVRGFGMIRRDEAQQLLPALIRAAIEAASSVEKYDAMVRRGPEDPPAELFCHVCGYGTRLSAQDSEWPSRCDERGHRAFGGREDEMWEQAAERHRREMSRWQFAYDMGLIPRVPPLTR
jgi:hypothetical protein